MPLKTTHYNLTAFQFGDTYSASADRRRFSIIDNQLSFLAEQIGDGVIDGWSVTKKDGETVTVAPGIGIIDGFLVVTYGKFDVEIPNNRRLHLFMRRKPEIIAQTGPFSDIAQVPYTDFNAPVAPVGLSVSESKYDYTVLNWTANAEPDLLYYKVYRYKVTSGYSSSSASSPYPYIHYADVETPTFKDSEIDDGSLYVYKVSAVDVNGHESPLSGSVLATVPYDVRVPSDPTELDVLSGNRTLQVYWGASNFLAKYYQITIQPLTIDGVPDGSPTSVTVSNSTFYYVFEGLDNGHLYQVTVSAKSKNGVLSPGVSGRSTPMFSGGAAELKSINISDFQIDSSYRIGLNVSWELQDDEYNLTPDYFIVTIYRDGEVGVPSIYTSLSNIITRYTVKVGNQEVTRDIEEETKYTVKIQTASDDVSSNGFVVRYRTKKFRPPQPITNLETTWEYTINKRSVHATWENSVSSFAYNALTVKKIPLDVDDEYTDAFTEILADNINYGQSSNYSVKVSDVENKYRYEFYVTTYDIYGNVSQTVAASAVVNRTFQTTTVGGVEVPNSGERPPVPTQQYTISGNDQVTIYWNAADSDFVNGYRVWRATFANSYSPSDFTSVTQLPADVRKYTDYGVENGQKYVYFVTSIDVFGSESLNPVDGYIYYAQAFAAPASHSELTKAPSLSVTANGHDAVLSWIPGDDAFDGYEIFRSENNTYSFKAVGNVGPTDSQFVDTDALVKDGKYYYMMRKFRNEAEIYTSRNRLAPAGTLSLGLISRFGSTITIDRSDVFSIKLLEDPIKREIHDQLQTTTHLFYNVGDDRRVRLQDNLAITEWTTADYQTFTTEYSMHGTGEYIAYIGGVQSPYSTVIDRDKGTISFEQPIFDSSVNDGKAEEDQIDPPDVAVVFLNVSEVTGTLSPDNVEPLSAAKVVNGKLPLSSIPQLNHLGRYREKCVPASIPMTAVNPQVYSGSTPTGVTFYDVFKTADNKILAATSNGMMITSSLGGSSFDTVLQTNYAAQRVIYSPYLKMYFAAIGPEVRVSKDGLKWLTASGMEGSTFVRDLVSDENGTVYATTDSGVYKIQPLEFTKLFWQQLNLFDSNDTNAYGIAYYSDTEELVVSGSSGIYGTFNDGQNWHRLDGGEIQVPVHAIVSEGHTVFLVSNNKVWRWGSSENVFKVIGDFASPCRRGAIFAGDFYVTTDNGLYRSATSDVLTGETVKWQIAFPNTARNGIMPATHALRVIDGRLWMGQDERLYSATVKRSVYTHADLTGTCPTVYVNDAERSVGVYYSTANQVAFDVRLEADDKVSIVRQYTNFQAINGGWADTKYDASVLININGDDVIGPPVIKLINGRYWKFPPKPWTAPNDTKTIAAAISQITTPYFSGRTSNFDKANASLKKIVQMSDAINTLDYLGEVDTVPSSDVANLFNEIERFKTYIHPELRQFIKYPPINGVVNYNGFTALFDVITGKIEITGGVDKYTKVALTVKGVFITNEGVLSHDELEEGFDKWNSGLTAPLALVQQSNLIKAGIYEQQLNPNALRDGGFTYQAVHHGACDQWYDKFMSTIDYEQKLEQMPPVQGEGVFESTGFSIDYPADILYVPTLGEVWVCGGGGIIAINKTSLDVRKVYGSPFYFHNMVLSGGIVYALCEDGVYTVNPSNGRVAKDVNLVPPTGFNSVYVNGNTTYIGTNDGVYSKRPFELAWTKVFSLTDAAIRSSPRLTFAVGKNPDDLSDSLVYYSFQGVVWNRSNTFSDTIVTSVTQRYNTVYYGTNSGLLVEDLSKLFSNSDFSGPLISAANLEDDDALNTAIVVNDVDADDGRVIVGTDTGKWYSMSGASVDGSGQSRLETIHKVKVVDGKYWLFSDNMIEIENVNRLIPLSTGKALF